MLYLRYAERVKSIFCAYSSTQTACGCLEDKRKQHKNAFEDLS